MSAEPESGNAGLPEHEGGDLPEALRAGLPALHEAAAGAGIDAAVVDAVISAAWDALRGFRAHGVTGYREVVDLAIRTNGRTWATVMLVDRVPRDASFRSVTDRARRYGHWQFSRLPDAEREAAADDAMVQLSSQMTNVQPGEHRVPTWTVWPIVRKYANWRLLDAAKVFDRQRQGGAGNLACVSLDAYFEACGEHGVTSISGCVGSTDEHGVEAVVWAGAHAMLERRKPAMISGTRAGSALDKLTLTIDAAKWVLAAGSQDRLQQGAAIGGTSAEEVRQQFAQDAILVCFHGLRAAAPLTWGSYPTGKVPTREVIERIAKDAEACGDVNAAWFARLEARRVDVAKSNRVLHGVRGLVESLIKEAAQENDDQ